MSDVVQKAVSANPIYQGSATIGVAGLVLASGQTLRPDINTAVTTDVSNSYVSGIFVKYSGYYDEPTYYSA